MHVDDINWEGGLLSVISKGGKADFVNISSRGLEALRIWLDNRQIDTEKVFGSIEYYDAWRLLRNISKRGKFRIELRPHLLRHSRAIQMLRNGATIYAVQQHLRHRSISTTMNIYGRFKAGDLKEQIPKW